MVLPVIAARVAVWGGKKVATKVGGKVGDKVREKAKDKLQDSKYANSKYGAKLAGKLETGLGKSGRSARLPAFSRGDGGDGGDGSETKPYLNKWDNISQVWINRWTVLLFLVLARVLIQTGSVSDEIGSAKEKVLSACLKLETVGSALVSMPHYMSQGINEMTADGIEGVVKGIATLINFLITAVQSLIIFIIDMWRATYLCLLQALLDGAFLAAEKVVEGAVKAAEKITEGIADVMDKGVGWIEDVMGIVDKIPGVDLPDQIDLGDASDKLRNIDINADDAVSFIRDVQDKIPTFEEIQDETAKLIAVPFNKLKELVSDRWLDFKFDRELLPVAAKTEVDICSSDENIPAFFDGLSGKVDHLKSIFIGVCVGAAILAILFFAFMEVRRWNRAQQTVALANDEAVDLMDAAWVVSNPYTARGAFWFSEKLTKDQDKQLLIRWVVAYATSPIALFVLALAISGFLVCLLEYLLLQALRNEIPKLTAEIGGLAAGLVTNLDQVSGEWAQGANGVILDFQNDVNEDLFGGVKDVAQTVRKGIRSLTKGIQDGLNLAFGGTPFHDPVETVVDCVLVDKLEKIDTGLRYVIDRANISFPTLPNDTFSVEKLASGDGAAFLDNPQQASLDEIDGAVKKVTDHLIQNIITELLISSVLLLIYFIVVLMGVGTAVYKAHMGLRTGHVKEVDDDRRDSDSLQMRDKDMSEQYLGSQVGVAHGNPGTENPFSDPVQPTYPQSTYPPPPPRMTFENNRF